MWMKSHDFMGVMSQKGSIGIYFLLFYYIVYFLLIDISC